MKRKLFTKAVAIISLVAVLVSPMSVGSYASTQDVDDTDYLFYSYLEDSIGSCVENIVQIKHVGQLLTSTSPYGSYYSYEVSPVNSRVYFNAELVVSYRASATESEKTVKKYGKLYLGLPDTRTWFDVELEDVDYYFDTGRIVNRVDFTVKLSQTAASSTNGVGSTYRSLVTGVLYEKTAGWTLSEIFDHGYDYLAD